MLQKLNKSRGGFTLVEIMIVVAIIALLAAIAVPNFLRARKRSQATTVLNDLRLIDSAKDQYAIEKNLASGTPTGQNLAPYFKSGSRLYNTASTGTITDIFGNAFITGDLSTLPAAPAATRTALNDVVEPAFWSPYN